MRAVLAGMAAALILTGCAAKPETNCAIIDWSLLGLADGEHGAPADRFGFYARTCQAQLSPSAIDLARVQYLEAREEGLRDFCRPENGYRVGRSGKPLVEACPQTSAASFREAFILGERWHLLTERILDLNQEIRDIYNDADETGLDDYERTQRILEVEAEIRDLETRLDANATWPPAPR